MKRPEFARATSVADAVARVGARADAVFLAGGTNLVDHMKLGIVEPGLLVEVTRLGLDEVSVLPDGTVRIGAMVRNSDLAADPVIRRQFPVLSQALLAGASGQLRNMATVGGNLMQRTRCVYFQDVTTPCNKREPGSGCPAIEGYHRDHAILGASTRCVAVHPSDMAVALSALDAVVRVSGPGGDRTVPIGQLYPLPGDAPDRHTVLEHGELITAVDLPVLPMAVHSRYRKVRERASYAFALVSVAVVADIRAGYVRDVRIGLGGVAPRPWRAEAAEDVLRGTAATSETVRRAVDAELSAARPLPGNAFKTTLVRGVLVAVVRDLVEEAGS